MAELVEEIAAARNDREVADLIDDEQARRQKNLIFSRRTPSRSALAGAPMMSARLPK